MKTVRWTVFNEQYFVWISKRNYGFVPSKTSHCDVLEVYFAAHRKKGERSCPLPLGMTVVIPHPFHRFGGYAPAGAGKDFAVCGRRPKGSALWTSAAFEKAGETFP
ncbi:MAG: hypothetical protein K2J11_10135 [Oscillospiraceae bacterium]|nr:hypothetical protein [Oscillospiraceae bacterium]